jgi:hypothetical protein
MAERRFLILKRMGRTPSLATCEQCHLKFFVPLELIKDPEKAELGLRQKYADHKCKKTALPGIGET